MNKYGDDEHFKYTRILEEDATCVTFQAEISDPVEDDSPDIVVNCDQIRDGRAQVPCQRGSRPVTSILWPTIWY